MELTPKEIVHELDKYIVGQSQAKRSVAVALRNRWRSKQLPPDMQDDIVPKNILMIGPTGVGKTEIARRLAKLVNAPFVKVEATKFTEIGYVGRDVESMVRDVVETAIRMVKTEKILAVNDKASELALERVMAVLLPSPQRDSPRNPFEMIFGGGMTTAKEDHPIETPPDDGARRVELLQRLRSGEMDESLIEIIVDDNSQPMAGMLAGSGIAIYDTLRYRHSHIHSHTIYHIHHGRIEKEIITHEHEHTHIGPGMAHHHLHKIM